MLIIQALTAPEKGGWSRVGGDRRPTEEDEDGDTRPDY